MTANKQFHAMAQAFPDFDQSTLPPIPEDWQDQSWRGARFSDACPQWLASPAGADGQGVRVIINWEDRCGCGDSYIVCLFDVNGECLEEFGGDDWAAILAHVEEYRAKWAPMLDSYLAREEEHAPTLFARLVAKFQRWTIARGMLEGDAMDCLYRDDITKEERLWLSDFVREWDAMEERDRELRSLLEREDLTPRRRAALEAQRDALGR